jgi:hypothetical protein
MSKNRNVRHIRSASRTTGVLPVAVLCLGVTVTPASAQLPRPSIDGRTFLSISGGLTFGPGTLWMNSRQPLVNPNLTPAPGAPDYVDTLAISQGVNHGSAFSISITRFVSNGFGFGTDFVYHGFHRSKDCQVFYDSAFPFVTLGANPLEVSSPNLSACNDVRQQSSEGATLDFMPFLTWRMLPESEITPAIKAGAGLSLVPCTVRVYSALRDLINGECTSNTQPMWGMAIGFYRQTDLESQFHVEVRYSVHRWGVVDGNADLTGNASVLRQWHGGFGFAMGVDFQV